jgi:hypothetical protein
LNNWLTKAIRLHDWWHFILPPIFAFYFAGLQVAAFSGSWKDLLTGLLALAALAVPMAAFGFFLNDWTDISEDAAGGKSNFAAPLHPIVRMLLMAIITGVLAGVMILYPFSSLIRILLVFQAVALILYSSPPFRLKNKPVAAVLLDATYSGTIFFLIALLLSIGSAEWHIMLVAYLFGMVKGLRNIIYHLQQDKSFDTTVGKKTMAHVTSEGGVQKTQEVLWLIESGLLIYLGYFTNVYTYSILILGFILILIKRHFYLGKSFTAQENKNQWLGELNTLYEIWFLLAAVTGVMVGRGIFALVISYAMLFFVFPYTRKVFQELYIALYNLYYFVSDLYFIYTKPYFDIGKFFRRIFRRNE